MKQSKLMSFLESALSTLAGFGISLAAQWYFLPLLGVTITFSQNLIFAVIMTAVSIGRGFVLRRLFEALHIRRPLSPFAQAAIAERFAQLEREGFDAAHDDAHIAGELALAGACYAIQVASGHVEHSNDLIERLWPWERSWWKPADVRRMLVKSCALLIAEGERYDRKRKRRRSGSGVRP